MTVSLEVASRGAERRIRQVCRISPESRLDRREESLVQGSSPSERSSPTALSTWGDCVLVVSPDLSNLCNASAAREGFSAQRATSVACAATVNIPKPNAAALDWVIKHNTLDRQRKAA